MNERLRPDRQVERLERRLAIAEDGTIVARSGKVEYGQNVRETLARIVAVELDVPAANVRVELGDPALRPGDLGAFGSRSTAADGLDIRAAAACARAQLIQRAAQRLGVNADDLITRGGAVVAADHRSLTYQELTADEPLSGDVPEHDADERAATALRDVPARVEARDIVTGAPRFAADIRLPGMLRGHVLAPSEAGARLASVDDRAARPLPGVRLIVHEGEFVGVVADRDEQAIAAVRALEATWAPPEPVAAAPTNVVLRHDEGVHSRPSPGAVVLEARYFAPHIAPAALAPSAAVADVGPDRVDIYTATLRPLALREEIARLLDRPMDDVRVHVQAMGGRGSSHEVALDAARLSRASERPVLVQWTRPEEFQLAPHRALLDAEAYASVSAEGALEVWRYRALTNPCSSGDTLPPVRLLELTAGRNAIPPYRLGRAEVVVQVMPADVRTGPFRSQAAALHVFAIESFVSELAHAAAQDPIAFRLSLIDDARLRQVLETVRDRSAWGFRAREEGRGFGVACAMHQGTPIAQVAEVVVARSGRVHLERVWCAADPGRLVHPDGARQQIEGGIMQAASWALYEELRHHDAEVISTTWREYPIATFRDAPRQIEVMLAGSSAAPTGVDEAAPVPTAAAIANAIYDACGARIRRLPISPAAVAAARR